MGTWSGTGNCCVRGRTAKKRSEAGVCSYKASTCEGPLYACSRCGYVLCEYHFPTHVSLGDRSEWRGLADPVDS